MFSCCSTRTPQGKHRDQKRKTADSRVKTDLELLKDELKSLKDNDGKKETPEFRKVCWPRILKERGFYHENYKFVSCQEAQFIIDTALLDGEGAIERLLEKENDEMRKNGKVAKYDSNIPDRPIKVIEDLEIKIALSRAGLKKKRSRKFKKSKKSKRSRKIKKSKKSKRVKKSKRMKKTKKYNKL